MYIQVLQKGREKEKNKKIVCLGYKKIQLKRLIEGY